MLEGLTDGLGIVRYVEGCFRGLRELKVFFETTVFLKTGILIWMLLPVLPTFFRAIGSSVMPRHRRRLSQTG